MFLWDSFRLIFFLKALDCWSLALFSCCRPPNRFHPLIGFIWFSFPFGSVPYTGVRFCYRVKVSKLPGFILAPMKSYSICMNFYKIGQRTASRNVDFRTLLLETFGQVQMLKGQVGVFAFEMFERFLVVLIGPLSFLVLSNSASIHKLAFKSRGTSLPNDLLDCPN